MASMVREMWTDERLDDLKGSVDAGFRENREEFRAVRVEMREEFKAVRGEIAGVREEVAGVRAEIGAMSRTFAQLAWGLVGAMLVGFLGTIVAIVTQM